MWFELGAMWANLDGKISEQNAVCLGDEEKKKKERDTGEYEWSLNDLSGGLFIPPF